MKTISNSLLSIAITLLALMGCADTGLAQVTTFSATPTTIAFTGQTGSASFASPATITVTATNGPVSFAVTSVTSLGAWLTVTPSSGLAGDTGTVLIASVNTNANTLTPGNYPGTITLTATGLPPVTINATLTIANGTINPGLNAAPTPVIFTLQGGNIASQLVSLTTTAPSTVVTISSAVNGPVNWLSFTPLAAMISPGTPVSITVTANSTGLTNGVYNGTVIVTPTAGTALNIPVTLNVTGAIVGSGLIVSPNPLNVSLPMGSTVTSIQTLTFTTAVVGGVSFTAVPSTSTGGTWLTSFPASSLTALPGTPATLTVTINPTNLVANTYSGKITITPSGGAPPFDVPVNLTITGAPALNVSPASFSFAYQTGTAFPLPQTLTIGATGLLSFSIIPNANPGSWLVVNPQNGAVIQGGPPANVTVAVNPAGLPVGTYTGVISVISNGASNSPIDVPVRLVISDQPILSFSNSGITLNYQLGNSSFPSGQVQVTSSGNPLPFTVSTTVQSGGNFLSVSPSSGTTPQVLTFTLNPIVIGGLGAGTYTEAVNVASASAGNSPQTYIVTLNISNSTLLTGSQNALSFNYQIGQTQPPLQTLGIGSTGAPLNYAVTSISNNCGNFLTVTPANGMTAAGSIAVGVNTTGLVAGTCTGTVTISSQGAANTITVPVTLFVSAAALLNVSPTAINVVTQVGTNPVNQTISLTSTDPTKPLAFSVSTTPITGGNFLLVGPTSGTTPSNLNLGFTTSGLPVGTYNSTITISSTGPANAPVVVPVTLVIAPSATAAATPTSLTFNQPLGGPAPSNQTLTLNSTAGGLNYTVSATTLNGNNTWLTVTPTAGITPSSVAVSVNGAGLIQGMYSGVVTFVVAGAAVSPINVPVTLVVGPSQGLVLGANAVNFNFQAGASTTPTQTIQVTSIGGNVPFTATATSPGNFLTVTPAAGTTPGPVSIGLSQTVLATLAPGNYAGTVTLASPNLASQTINVTLTVTAAPPPTISSVVNAASNQSGSVSPGEIVAIFGVNIGPAVAAGLVLTPQGTVSTSLGNTVVAFDGVAAPLIFVSANQINAIVPYEIAGRVSTNVVVTRGGQSSPALQLRVADTAPSIFSLSQGGNGQGAILNSNGTVNSASNPAAKGSVIVIYATGEGVTRPQPATGAVTSATGTSFPAPVNNVSVKIGGASVTTFNYIGEAPGLVAGVLQINAVIPQGIGSGPQTVELNIGGASNNQQTITVAVQ